MKQSEVCVTLGVRFDGEDPFIETRARVIRSADASLPEGKVFVFKTPILPPGASDEEVRALTTMQVLDD
jgi:hypothetical protein